MDYYFKELAYKKITKANINNAIAKTNIIIFFLFICILQNNIF